MASGQVEHGGPDGRRAARAMDGPSGGPRPLAGHALQLPALRRPGAGPDDRRRAAVEADRRPPRRAVLVAAPAGPGSGDHPPDPRHRPGGVAPGACGGAWCRAMLRRWRRHPRSRSGSSTRRPRPRWWRSSTRPRRWSRCSGSTSGWWRPPGCGARRRAGCGGATSTSTTGGSSCSAATCRCPGSVGDQPTKTRSVRTVTLDPDTVGALRSAWRAARQLARFAGVDDDRRRAGYVFSFDADGASRVAG